MKWAVKVGVKGGWRYLVPGIAVINKRQQWNWTKHNNKSVTPLVRLGYWSWKLDGHHIINYRRPITRLR